MSYSIGQNRGVYLGRKGWCYKLDWSVEKTFNRQKILHLLQHDLIDSPVPNRRSSSEKSVSVSRMSELLDLFSFSFLSPVLLLWVANKILHSPYLSSPAVQPAAVTIVHFIQESLINSHVAHIHPPCECGRTKEKQHHPRPRGAWAPATSELPQNFI